MWPFRKRHNDETDPDLQEAAYMVRRLEERASTVERHLRTRHERNHWSETVNELWQGRAPA